MKHPANPAAIPTASVRRVLAEPESAFSFAEFVVKAHAAALAGNETRALLLPERPILRVDGLTTAPKACLRTESRIPTVFVQVVQRKQTCRRRKNGGHAASLLHFDALGLLIGQCGGPLLFA